MTRKDITKEQYAEALRICDGVKARAARLLGVHRSTITNVCIRHKDLEQICIDAVNELLDETQFQLMKGVRMGNREDMRMVLQYYGHLRGLVQAKDITSGGAAFGGTGTEEADVEELEAALAVLLHDESMLKLLDQVYLEFESNADRKEIIDAEFSNAGTSGNTKAESK